MTFIYLGCNGFPYGMAQVERQKLLAKSLVALGHKVVIISEKGIHSSDVKNISNKGIYDGIDYIYTSGTPYRPNSFFKRNFYKCLGLFGEFFYLLKLRCSCKIEAALVTSMLFSSVFYYWILSKIFGFKLILDYVELNSSLITPHSKGYKNFLLFEKHAPRYFNKIIGISDFLITFVKKQNPDLSVLKIPVVCDIDKIDSVTCSKTESKYFLFCGSVFYIEVIEFVLQSYALCNSRDFELYLIVSGDAVLMEKFKELVRNHPKGASIKVFSKLPYEQLIDLYKNAKALLIPLRDTKQDEARFPHKIGEYTASRRPVITTKHGEIVHYFTDMENALIADSYSVKEYSLKMEFVINNPDLAGNIGENGRQVCNKNFDYRIYGEPIISLISR